MNDVRDVQVRFLALAECTSDAVFITDFDSARFVEVNARTTDLLGYTREELCTMTGRHLHPPEDGDIVSVTVYNAGQKARRIERMKIGSNE